MPEGERISSLRSRRGRRGKSSSIRHWALRSSPSSSRRLRIRPVHRRRKSSRSGTLSGSFRSGSRSARGSRGRCRLLRTMLGRLKRRRYSRPRRLSRPSSLGRSSSSSLRFRRSSPVSISRYASPWHVSRSELGSFQRSGLSRSRLRSRSRLTSWSRSPSTGRLSRSMRSSLGISSLGPRPRSRRSRKSSGYYSTSTRTPPPGATYVTAADVWDAYRAGELTMAQARMLMARWPRTRGGRLRTYIIKTPNGAGGLINPL